jgi:hypothetical protein
MMVFRNLNGRGFGMYVARGAPSLRMTELFKGTVSCEGDSCDGSKSLRTRPLRSFRLDVVACETVVDGGSKRRAARLPTAQFTVCGPVGPGPEVSVIRRIGFVALGLE